MQAKGGTRNHNGLSFFLFLSAAGHLRSGDISVLVNEIKIPLLLLYSAFHYFFHPESPPLFYSISFNLAIAENIAN